MADIVNLRQVRKRVARAQAQDEAATNRARFGRTCLERERDAREAALAADRVEKHRIEGEDAS